MKENEKTLQEKLAGRKYKVPNKFFHKLYYYIGGTFVMPKYNYHLTVKDPIPKEGACFLVWNHLSRRDHFFLLKAAYPRPINIVAAYSEFFRSHLHVVFKLMNILPKKIFTNDLVGVKAIMSIIKQGGCVCFSPEGMSSIYGTNQPVVPGTGRFIKHFGIPVYFLKLKGSYLTSTKICCDDRKGRIDGELSCLFTEEQLDAMTPEEIEDALNAAFRHDDYAWGREQGIKWKHKGGMAENLETVCYKCPKCGAEGTMIAEGDDIKCSACGNGAHINDYYVFEPYDDGCVIPASPAEWFAGERRDIIKEIRGNENFSYSQKVKLGYLPEHRYVGKMQTTEPCGDGVITADHSGIRFSGTKLGEKWEFALDYSTVFSLVVMTDTTHYGFYVNEEYFEFFPTRADEPTGKMLLVVEEMHRLHFNTWKNFPWNEELYK